MEPASHVVILVHGIRDFALWQTTIRATLEEAGLRTEATNYGRFNLLEFLAPIPFFRNKAIETVWNQIQIIKQNNEGASLSIIAHSFGTYVIARLMQQKFNVRFNRVIFCGSVVRYGFPFEQFQDRFSKPIVNEVGTRDIWPAMAESITVGYGSAGTYGFNRPLVRDRWHNKARHGFFLNADFCKKFWIPYLRDGILIPGDIAPERPRLWIQLLSIVKVKYLLVGLALVALTTYATRSDLFRQSKHSNAQQEQAASAAPREQAEKNVDNNSVSDAAHPLRVRALTDRISCELRDLVRDDRPDDPTSWHRNLLLHGDYDVAMTLSLAVNDSGDLAPSPTDITIQSRSHNYTQDIFRSTRNVYRDWKTKTNPQDCPAEPSGALGFKDAVANAAQSRGIDDVSPPPSFGGVLQFTIKRNTNTSNSSYWRLETIKESNGAKRVSETNIHKITFAFAPGPNMGKPMTAATASREQNQNALSLLQKLQSRP